MSLNERIEALKTKHQSLESDIKQEHHRPHPDDIGIAELKKQKLVIKDRITELSNS